MSRGRCPSSRILIGALAPNHDTSRHCWRVDAGQRALGSGSARRLVTTRFDRAMRSALEPALHEDLGAAASTTLERSADTGSHGAKPTRERRRSCATTSRRRRAGCARLRASSAASRGPRRRVHTQTRDVQVLVVVVVGGGWQLRKISSAGFPESGEVPTSVGALRSYRRLRLLAAALVIGRRPRESNVDNRKELAPCGGTEERRSWLVGTTTALWP